MNSLSLRAGDTFTTSYPDDSYSALKFILSGPRKSVVDGELSDGKWSIRLTADQTQTLLPAWYDYSIRVTDIYGDKYTVETGKAYVADNPETAPARRMHAETMIDLIDKCLVGQLSDEEAAASLSIGGRSISYLDREALLRERAYWVAIRNASVRGTSGGAVTTRPINLPSRY